MKPCLMEKQAYRDELELTEAIRRLATNHLLRQTLGATGRDRALQNFLPEQTFAPLLAAVSALQTRSVN
jgi:hypothetical protein